MDSNRNEWIVIGISGVTCGGKTTLSNKLKALLTPVYIFHQDKYFYPDDSPKHVKCKDLPHNDYDVLSSLDMDLMHSEVLLTMAGNDHSQDRCLKRNESKMEVKGKKFLVVEGFTVLNFKALLELCDLRYYLVLQYGECLQRRSLRVYEPPDVAGYFELCVWPHFQHYRAQIEKDHRVKIVSGAQPDVLSGVMDDLLTLGATELSS